MIHCNSYTVVFSVLYPLLNMCPELQDNVKQNKSATLHMQISSFSWTAHDTSFK